MQQTPAWVAFGDQAGEHGEEPASSTAPRIASSAAAYTWLVCVLSTWARCWPPFSSLASIGISATPMTQASIPVTAAAVPSGPGPGR
jgi:hypothetical protein